MNKKKVEDIEIISDKEIETLSYEEAFEKMNYALMKLEDGNISLDNSLDLYEYGIKLYKRMNHILDNADIKITEIKEKIDK